MSDSEWGGLEAEFVQTLREEKVEPVPEPIVRLAQASLTGRAHPADPTHVLHAMQRVFETPERAEAFARHMRNAGLHTTPPSSITVVVDPERGKIVQLDEAGEPVMKDGKPVRVPGPPVNPCKVAWRAGARRGRTSG